MSNMQVPCMSKGDGFILTTITRWGWYQTESRNNKDPGNLHDLYGIISLPYNLKVFSNMFSLGYSLPIFLGV